MRDDARIDKEPANLLHNSSVNMKIFRIILIAAAAAAPLWIAPACEGTSPLFDSTNLDPHPPQVTSILVEQANLGIGITGQRITFNYFDAGEDIEELELIPLGLGATQANTIVEPVAVDASIFFVPEGEEPPTEVVFFPGETGEIQIVRIWQGMMVGRHVIKIFLVDSKETRSEPLYFYVDIPDPR